MADDGNYRTFKQLADHLMQAPSNQIFAIEGSAEVALTTGKDRDLKAKVPVDTSGQDAAVIARDRGRTDMEEFSHLTAKQRQKQIQRMDAFVKQQSIDVANTWESKRLPNVFEARAKALLDGEEADRYRTSAGSRVGGRRTGGWDENIQTEIVHSRIQGRQEAIDDFTANFGDQTQTIKDLKDMHKLLAISSSLVRTPTTAVAGGFDGITGATAAHPGPRKDPLGSAMGNNVGASPRAHALRTGIMQAFEESARLAGADLVERQMARAIIAKKATTNAFEAPTIPGVTNDAFSGAKRKPNMHDGREADKESYGHTRTTAMAMASPDFNDFIKDQTRGSSPAREFPPAKKKKLIDESIVTTK